MGAAPTCDQAAVAFLGLSLAAWNGLYAAALGVAGLVAAAAGRGGRLRRASARP
jgi:disulfide bond formation protein DsbB